MMKHFLSIIRNVAVCSAGFLYSCVGNTDDNDPPVVYKGDFKLSEDARSFIIKDTVTTAFKMIDNNDITDKFVNSTTSYYGKYHGVYKYSDHSSETFGIDSRSFINNYSFNYNLTADKSAEMSINISGPLGSQDFRYDFISKKVVTYYYNQIPEVKFYDEMEVRGVIYHKIMVIDYSASQDKLENSFPIYTYYSIEKGLIKFIRKDGIYFERI